MNTPRHIKDALLRQKEKNRYRSLIDKSALVDFSSNDFFGLARNADLHKIIEERYESLLVNNSGATGSRLLSGHSHYFTILEEKLAEIHKGESALLFNSGYVANLSLLSTLPQKGDYVFYDQKIHASIKDGVRLSIANTFSFRHNDAEDLDRRLSSAKGEKYVVVESIYSMDGDFCNINSILEVCEKYGAYLIVDEAHSTGIYGKSAGWCVEKQVYERVFARVFTFGKAIGNAGACIIGNSNLKNFLINFARPFIYTTALPLHNLVSIECAFDYVINNSSLKNDLERNILHFKNRIETSSTSAVQSIVIPGNEAVKEVSQKIERNGLDVRPILSPTVREGEERLRICLHSHNTLKQIDKLIETL